MAKREGSRTEANLRTAFGTAARAERSHAGHLKAGLDSVS